MTSTLLESNTNSAAEVPTFAKVDSAELLQLHKDYAGMVDWDKKTKINYLSVNESPSIEFLNSSQQEWSPDADYWEDGGVKIFENKLIIFFIHVNTGHELFFIFPVTENK